MPAKVFTKNNNKYMEGNNMRKYRTTFEFTATEKEAQELCDRINANYTRYMRKNHPAHYTKWDAQDGKSNMHFVVWYQV